MFDVSRPRSTGRGDRVARGEHEPHGHANVAQRLHRPIAGHLPERRDGDLVPERGRVARDLGEPVGCAVAVHHRAAPRRAGRRDHAARTAERAADELAQHLAYKPEVGPVRCAHERHDGHRAADARIARRGVQGVGAREARPPGAEALRVHPRVDRERVERVHVRAPLGGGVHVLPRRSTALPEARVVERERCDARARQRLGEDGEQHLLDPAKTRGGDHARDPALHARQRERADQQVAARAKLESPMFHGHTLHK
jgi:hypothetical protein